MSITLSDLRLYAAENAAADPSGTTADREIQHWINQALQRVHAEARWIWFKQTGRLTVVPAESFTGLTLTQGSRVVSLSAGTFDQKYLSERWQLHVDGESRMTFELAEITSPTTALLKIGHEWPNSTSATNTGVWSRHIYQLPEGVHEILYAEDMISRARVHGLEPGDFDFRRQADPTSRQQPRFFTVRGDDEVELHPAAGSDYRTILFSYSRKAPQYRSDAVGTTVVDFPEKFKDVLLKRILVEAALTQGDNAVVPHQAAVFEYERALQLYEGENNHTQYRGGPMGEPQSGPNFMDIHDWPSSIPEV